jgi:hypothetical protein
MQSRVTTAGRAGCGARQATNARLAACLFQLTEQALDRLHGGLVEVGFAALTAHPGGNRFQGQMVVLAVDMKGRLGLPHFPLAGNPFSGPVAKLVTIWPLSTARALRQVQ